MYKKYCGLFFLMILTACTGEVNTVEIELSDSYDQKSVLEELKRNGANCSLIKQELYCDPDDMSLVNKIIRDISLREFPAGRSIYLGMPGLHDAVVEELNNRNIPYETKVQQNENWLIVEEGNLELLKDIINEKRHELRLAEQ